MELAIAIVGLVTALLGLAGAVLRFVHRAQGDARDKKKDR